MANEMVYGNGTNSSVNLAGTTQINQEFYNKKAVIDLKDDMYLSQLSDAETQPKHFGKTMKKYKYIPLLDDENVNSQGLDVTGVALVDGNLYGSSRDVGTINGKLPVLSETGGRVNRVGYTRKEISATIENYGFFHEFSKDSMNFDTDAELNMHITREAVRGATQINEDILALALINGAGVNYFAGSASSILTVTGEVDDATAAIPTYADLINLDIELDNNKCPKDTKVIVGSSLVDTKTVQAGRYMFISADVKASFMNMVDFHGNPAFISVEKYADGNGNGKYIKSIHGEIGVVGPFRIVVHPNMVIREGAGATATLNAAGLRETGSKYDVYPCLVVGSGSFSHVGFEYGAGAKSKFKVRTKMPEETMDRNDPYAKMGLSSIEWWQGVLIDRPEWIAVYNIGGEIF
jgi:N4-gp56 family major capsid protein